MPWSTLSDLKRLYAVVPSAVSLLTQAAPCTFSLDDAHDQSSSRPQSIRCGLSSADRLPSRVPSHCSACAGGGVRWRSVAPGSRLHETIVKLLGYEYLSGEETEELFDVLFASDACKLAQVGLVMV